MTPQEHSCCLAIRRQIAAPLGVEERSAEWARGAALSRGNSDFMREIVLARKYADQAPGEYGEYL